MCGVRCPHLTPLYRRGCGHAPSLDAVQAAVTQLVAYQLPKLGVAGSSPVSRSMKSLHGHLARADSWAGCP